MISWIQQTFQQHFRVIFGLLLAVVIISFVFTIGAAPGIGNADRQIRTRPFFGANLASEADQRKVFGDANISIFLQAGFMGALDEGRMQQYALTRFASLALADKVGIPSPSRQELQEHIQNMPRFAGENGQFDPKKYSDFRDSIRKNASVSEADVSRVLSDDIRAERVQKLLGGPGYVLPAEVKKELAAADTTWSISVATIDYSSFNPEIKPTEAEITKFFEDNAFRYEIQPQVSVSYVEFSAAAYVDEVNVSEIDVRAYYDANPARFPKPDQAKSPAPQVASADPAADFALVRPQVENALRLERAQRLAAKAASDFALLLYERKVNLNSPELAKLLAEHNLTLKDAPAFSENAVPAELGSNPQVAEAAFRMNKDRSISDAIPTNNGSVVLFWKDSIPSRTPLLAEVRAKVTSDFIAEEKRKRAAELGRTVQSQIAARVRSGEAFDTAAAAVAKANGLKVEIKSHPAFTLRQRPQDLDFSVFNALQSLEKGEVSELVRAQGDKGLIVYAADKKLPEFSDTNPEYASTRTQLAQFTAMRNSSDYVQELVQQELAKSSTATP